MTSDVLNLLRDNKILLTNVPPNMTKFYQPFDLTVNGFAKRFMARKCNDWYTEQVSAQLDKGISIDDIDIKLRLSLIKPLHASWLVDLYNHMTSGAAKDLIGSGWASSGIKDAINLGPDSLPSIDPFHDIAPMFTESNESSPVYDDRIFDLSPETISIGYSNDGESSDEEVWVPADENRNIFETLDELDDEEV